MLLITKYCCVDFDCSVEMNQRDCTSIVRSNDLVTAPEPCVLMTQQPFYAVFKNFCFRIFATVIHAAKSILVNLEVDVT